MINSSTGWIFSGEKKKIDRDFGMPATGKIKIMPLDVNNRENASCDVAGSVFWAESDSGLGHSIRGQCPEPISPLQRAHHFSRRRQERNVPESGPYISAGWGIQNLPHSGEFIVSNKKSDFNINFSFIITLLRRRFSIRSRKIWLYGDETSLDLQPHPRGDKNKLDYLGCEFYGIYMMNKWKAQQELWRKNIWFSIFSGFELFWLHNMSYFFSS